MGYTKPIETENAIYVLSLEQHGKPDFSAFERYRPDFLAIEGEPNAWAKDALESMMVGGRAHNNSKWNEMLSKSLMESPLLLVDPFVTFRERWDAGKTSLFSAALLSASLVQAGVALWKKERSTKGATRRRFLLAGGLFLAAEAITPSLLRVPSYFPGEMGSIRERLSLWNDALTKIRSPVVVDARNAVIAEKLEQMAPNLRQRLGRKPIIMIHIGAGHHGISTYLRRPLDRAGTIRKLSPRIREGMVPRNLDACVELRWNSSTKKIEVKESRASISPMLSASTNSRRYQSPRSPPPEGALSLSRREFFGRILRPRRSRPS